MQSGRSSLLLWLWSVDRTTSIEQPRPPTPSRCCEVGTGSSWNRNRSLYSQTASLTLVYWINLKSVSLKAFPLHSLSFLIENKLYFMMCVCPASQWGGTVSWWDSVGHSQPWRIHQILADLHWRRTGQAQVSQQVLFYTVSALFGSGFIVSFTLTCLCSVIQVSSRAAAPWGASPLLPSVLR